MRAEVRHVAVVHAADGVRFVAASQCPEQLSAEIVRYIRRRCDDVLWPSDAAAVRALIDDDEPFAAIAMYFALTGQRWDEERLELEVGTTGSPSRSRRNERQATSISRDAIVRGGAMSSKQLVSWFSLVSLILIMWGLVFAVFGLGILPVDRSVLLAWESALYGAIMIGWGATLFFVGRVALRRRDPELARALFVGIALWLAIEAIFSVRYGVWFNVGVDAGVFVLFSVPLIASVRANKDRAV